MDSRGTSFLGQVGSTSSMAGVRSPPQNRPSGRSQEEINFPPADNNQQVEPHWFDELAQTGYTLDPDFKLDLDFLNLDFLNPAPAATPIQPDSRPESGTAEPQSKRAQHIVERTIWPRPEPPRPIAQTAAPSAATSRFQRGMPSMVPRATLPEPQPQPQPNQPAVSRKRKHVADPDDLPAPTRPRLQDVGGSRHGEFQPSRDRASGKLVPRLRRQPEIRNKDLGTARTTASRLRRAELPALRPDDEWLRPAIRSWESPRASPPRQPLRPLDSPPAPSRVPEINHQFTRPSTAREVRHIQDALLCTRLDFQRRTGLEPPATPSHESYAVQLQMLQAGAAEVWLLDSAPPVLYRLAGPWRDGIENWHGLKSEFDARVAGGFGL